MSYSYTTTETFTKTHARYIASKIAADLRKLQLYYDRPTDSEIEDYLVELTERLAKRYLGSFEAGFKKDGKRVVSLFYEVRSDGTVTDNQAGNVYARADITGASWFTYVTHSSTYMNLTATEQDTFDKTLPIDRTPGAAPTDGAGYWTTDHGYAGGGVGAARRTFRPA